jgi:hypothetical protein
VKVTAVYEGHKSKQPGGMVHEGPNVFSYNPVCETNIEIIPMVNPQAIGFRPPIQAQYTNLGMTHVTKIETRTMIKI